MSPHRSQPLGLLVSLAASTLDDGSLGGLEEWKAYALGRPPREGDDPRADALPTDHAAVSLYLRRHRRPLFDRICEQTWCRLAKDPKGRARQELVDSITPLVDACLDGAPPKLLAAILVRIGLGQYCTCRGRYLCGGVTMEGRPCRHEVGDAGALCWQHRFQREWFADG